jgi:uncharacterized protein YqfB (UPF0267 family)
MNAYKFGVKLFVSNPGAVNIRDFIPVFHGWIQQQKIAGHQLIDVHDYSHVHHGPGILLVAHEGNFSMDEAGGRLGLVYIRKQPATLRETVDAAFAAAKILDGVKFETGKFEIFVNDRLTTLTAAQIAEAVGGKVTQKSGDPRDRLTFIVQRS